METRERLVAAAVDIFTSMVMMEITAKEERPAEPAMLEDSISGLVGLAGTHKGCLAIHLPNRVAIAITSNFLGMEVDEVNGDVEDAVGELANMMGGDIKAYLSENGRDIELSLPTTIAGHAYEFQTNRDAERVIVPFVCDAGEFSIELQLEK